MDTSISRPLPKVVIASPNSLLNTGLRVTLQQEFTVIVESGDSARALTVARAERPDLVLIHADIPGNLLAAIDAITSEQLSTVVLLSPTRTPDEVLLLRALRSGARGVLPVTTAPERLSATLHGVLLGEAALPRAAVGMLLTEFSARPSRVVRLPEGRLVQLTPREWEILHLLRAGATTADIGKRLGVESVTVRTHIAALCRKLRVPQRNALRTLPLTS